MSVRHVQRRRIAVRAIGAAALAAASLGPVAAGDYAPPLVRVATPGGAVLAADRNGRTLYVRPRGDGARCLGRCSLDWPPFLVRPDDFPTDGLGILLRPDGSRQWAVGDRPLHFFVGDATRGETYGDGLGAWRALRPEALGAASGRARVESSSEDAPL